MSFKRRTLIISITTVILVFVMTGVALAVADPSGAATGGKASYDALYAGKSVKDAVGQQHEFLLAPHFSVVAMIQVSLENIIILRPGEKFVFLGHLRTVTGCGVTNKRKK